MPFGDTPADPDALLRPNRRDLLRVLGLTGAVGLAGCSGQQSTPTEAPTTAGGPGGGETATTAAGTPSATATRAASDGSRSVGGTWRSGSSTDAQSLFWIQVADAPSSARVGTALDGAYAVTTEEEVFPLWLDIETDDKRVYTCTLRDGLRWSEPYGQMTAEDWVYMINEVFEAEDNWAGFANQGDWMMNGEFIPVEKTGTLSFEIQLPDPDPAFPLRPIVWGQYCLPKGLLEQYVPDKDVEGLKQDEEIQTLAYAGNLGPYEFERWDRESEFVATRNPDYYMREADVPEKWQGAPYFERSVYKVIPEESTRLSALKTGEITTTGIPPNKVKQFETLDDVRVIQTPQPFDTLLIYNQRANGWTPFRRKGVRTALSWAVNKRAIVDQILRGYAQVAHTFQPEWSRWYDDSQVVETGVGDSYDPERARDLLADAVPSGYGYDGDKLVDPDGDQVSLKMVYGKGSQTTKTSAEFIAQEYAKVGIKLTLEPVQFNTLLDKYVRNSIENNDADTGDDGPDWNSGPFNAGNREEAVSAQPWDLMYGIRFNTYPRTPTDTRTFWEKQGNTNYYGYYPSVDMQSLYDTAASATDEATRQEALAEVFGVLSEDQPVNFISLDVSISGYQDEVAGFGPREFGFGWDSTTWYFSQ